MRDFAALQDDLEADLETKDHMLTSDMDFQTASGLWLSKSFWKKFQDNITKSADSRCLALFKLSNARCRDFVLSPDNTFEDTLIGQVKNLLDKTFFRGPEFTLEFDDILSNAGVGPGASLGVESYNFYTKLFDSNLSSTSRELHLIYRSATSVYPSWLRAENARSKRHGESVVGGNKLSFVPKTSEISRSICTEPNLNMFFQKGIGVSLERLLRWKFRIDLSQQPELNRNLALKGSIDGSFGTIDLSSASDSVSLTLLRELFPSYVVRWLELTRSPEVVYPDGSREELHMVSSMGNGFTFPLQTLLFSTIVVACYHILGIKPEYGTTGPVNFAVFGDDIIVRKDAYAFVVRALELFGFIVNDDKSFNSGYFRESCGGDFYNGRDIRGVYIKSLIHDADVYSAINRLVRWTARTGVFLPRTISRLRSWVKFLPIPYNAGDSEGIKVPHPPRYLKTDPKTGGTMYRALVKVPSSFTVPVDATEPWLYPRRFSRNRQDAYYNADGILIAFCGGYIRNGRITLRESVARYKFQKRVTSSWCSLYPSASIRRFEDGRIWVKCSEQFSAPITKVRNVILSNHNDSAAGLTRGNEWVLVSEAYALAS